MRDVLSGAFQSGFNWLKQKERGRDTAGKLESSFRNNFFDFNLKVNLLILQGSNTYCKMTIYNT